MHVDEVAHADEGRHRRRFRDRLGEEHPVQAIPELELLDEGQRIGGEEPGRGTALGQGGSRTRRPSTRVPRRARGDAAASPAGRSRVRHARRAAHRGCRPRSSPAETWDPAVDHLAPGRVVELGREEDDPVGHPVEMAECFTPLRLDDLAARGGRVAQVLAVPVDPRAHRVGSAERTQRLGDHRHVVRQTEARPERVVLGTGTGHDLERLVEGVVGRRVRR